MRCIWTSDQLLPYIISSLSTVKRSLTWWKRNNIHATSSGRVLVVAENYKAFIWLVEDLQSL